MSLTRGTATDPRVDSADESTIDVPVDPSQTKIPESERRNGDQLADSRPAPDEKAAKAPPAVPDGGWEAWMQVFGSFVIMVNTWGLINTFGVYQTFYETELLKDRSSSDISWIGSLQGALLLILGSVSGPLFDLGYFRALISVGLFMIVFGQFMTSLCTQYWQVLLAQGFCIGIGCGLLFLPSAAILSQYFAKRRAIALGLQSVGSPLAGIVFPIIFTRLQPLIGFGWATRVIAFIILGLSVIPLVSMRPRAPPPKTKRSLVDRKALQDPPFLAFSVGGLFAFAGLYVPYFYVQLYAIQHRTTSEAMAGYLVTLLNAGSVFGRLLPNFLADYLGSMNMLVATTVGAAALAFGWMGVRDEAGLVVFTLLFGFFNGGCTSLPPSAVVPLTPDLSMLGTRMGMAFIFFGVAVLVGTPIAGAILGSDGVGASWLPLMGFSGATLAFGALLFLTAHLIFLWGKRKTSRT